MRNIFLIVVLLLLSTNVKGQIEDILNDNSTPRRYLFNKVEIMEYDILTKEWNQVGYTKGEFNEIYFGIPKTVNMVEYYEKNCCNNDNGMGELLERTSKIFESSRYCSGCDKKKIKNLRINKYRNIQSSLELNVEDNFRAKGELDTGEMIYIIRSKNMSVGSYSIWIITEKRNNTDKRSAVVYSY